ncbi:MAG: M20 family metallopeptidase, partial [Planctomycetes bacterium]|nr:M20 family metallopeptidase [Planctomycetota bacterium]
MNEQVERFVENRRDSILELLSRLVAAKTVNPPGDEHLAAEIMRDALEPAGIECTAFEKEPGRTNMVARIGSGRPKILVACHFDVVPPGSGWQTDPFAAVVRDGRVYGRGTSDNKGQLAVMLEVARLLKKNEDQLIGEVILVGAADEERGSGLGLE